MKRILALIYTLLVCQATALELHSDFDNPDFETSHSKNLDQWPVVVIDSGIDYTHPDLKEKLYENIEIYSIDVQGRNIENDNYGYDFNNDDLYSFDNNYRYIPKFQKIPKIDREESLLNNFLNIGSSLLNNTIEVSKATMSIGGPGHGTHVSGIILKECDQCAIVPLKVFGKNDVDLGDLVAAIEYAHKRGYRILNLSLGVDTKYIPKDDVESIRHLTDLIGKITLYKDMLFVVAAGNDGVHLTEVLEQENRGIYPALLNLPNVITVGALDKNGKMAHFSNYDEENVDVYTDGVEIRSTWNDGSYKTLNGTSMATPKVTGLISNLWMNNRILNPEQIKELFLEGLESRELTPVSGEAFTAKVID